MGVSCVLILMKHVGEVVGVSREAGNRGLETLLFIDLHVEGVAVACARPPAYSSDLQILEFLEILEQIFESSIIMEF